MLEAGVLPARCGRVAPVALARGWRAPLNRPEVTALKAKAAAKTRCVPRQDAAIPLGDKVKLCVYNSYAPSSNGASSSVDGAGGYSLVLGLGTVNIVPFVGVKWPLAGPWTVNAAAIAAVAPYIG